MTNRELMKKAQELFDGGFDFELGNSEENIRIIAADDMTEEEAKKVYEYICDIKEEEYEGKTFGVKPYWLHESFSNEFEGCDDDTRFTFADVKTDARNFEMKVAEYIDKYLDVVE